MMKCYCKRLVMALATVFVALAAGCLSPMPSDTPGPVVLVPEVDAQGNGVVGVVRFHDAGLAIGGETDPHGYILEDSDLGRFEGRVYLRINGDIDNQDFKGFEGKRARVRGRLGRISAGGVETPLRFFSVIDVSVIQEMPEPEDPETSPSL